MADNGNPGNFANRPKEEVQAIAKKGGEASHSGGFASMDPDKQVGSSLLFSFSCFTL
jgi:general stress protein YciG